MLTRAISGLGLIIIVFGAILLGQYSALTLIMLIFTLGFIEFRNMFGYKDHTLFYTLLFGGLFAIVYFYLYFERIANIDWIIIFSIILLTYLILHHLFSSSSTFLEISGLLFAATWIAGTLIFYLGVGWQHEGGPYQAEYMIILLILIWVNDIAAYFFGSLFGKHHMAEKISPGKTWEGFIAGVLINAISGVITYKITQDISITFWILAAILVSLSSTAGDLFESKLKREANVKDSGNLIPGHGGILDRFDSLMFSAPVFFGILAIYNRV